MLFALLAILGESLAKTVDKLNYRNNKVGVRQQMLLTFGGMTVTLLLYILVARLKIPQLTWISLGLLSLVAVVSFGGNVFDELSLKADDLSLREPMLGFEPALAGFIGYLLFPSERTPAALIAFVAAIVIVGYGSSRRRLGRVQKRGLLYLFLAVVLYSVLPSLYKLTLVHIGPAYLALFRTSVILILCALFFKRTNKRSYTSRRVRYGLAAGFIYGIETVLSLYAILHLGVVQTMLFTLLGSALMYMSSYLFLKEKIRRGEVLSSALLAIIALLAIAL